MGNRDAQVRRKERPHATVEVQVQVQVFLETEPILWITSILDLDEKTNDHHWQFGALSEWPELISVQAIPPALFRSQTVANHLPDG